MGRVARTLALLLVGLAAAPTGAQEGFGARTPIEDPSGHALDAFHASLAAGRRTRVMVWGASHTAEDRFTGYLRDALQARYGDGGPGLVMPARPFELYDHRGVAIAEQGAWTLLRVNGRQREHDRYGPAGFAIEAR
ncbi:MAG: hypothetical protein KC619_07870, partial [Myxococcales bacterium]|nr:hypothetical protein [Myxococcales bacterium]